MTYGSLFSGAGGFDLGFHQAGFRCLWQVEVDRPCLSVLARHYPDADRFRDVIGMSRIPRRHGHWLDRWERPDVIIGGFPCQDLSVAGNRSGIMGGSRSGLWWQMLRVISGLRPKYVVWENVAGLLSSDDGRDLARIVFSLAERGYLGCYRTLDAQFFGVPQRRRRVFGVFARGCVGARRCAEVLALAGGVRRDTEESRQEKSVVAALTSCGVGTCGPDDNQAQAGHLIAFGGNNTSGERRVCSALSAKVGTGRMDFESETFILDMGNARSQEELGTLLASQQKGNRGHAVYTAYRNTPNHGSYETGNRTDALTTGSDRTSHVIAHTLRAEGFDASEDGTGRGTPLVACTLPASDGGASSGMQPVTATARGVRRLTPRECERLMGWPDDYTRWGHDGREMADGTRYRMCGNGVVAPVAEWIARRLMETEMETPNAHT